MKLFVKVKTRAKQASVTSVDENHFIVTVTAAPVRGQANAAVVAALAGYLRVAPARLEIVAGAATAKKVIVVR